MAKGARAKAKVHKKPAEKVNKKPAAKVHKKPAKKDAPKAKPKAKQGPLAAAYEPAYAYDAVHGYSCSECLGMLGGMDTYGHTWEACLKCDKVTCFNCTKRVVCTHCKGRGVTKVCTRCNGQGKLQIVYGEYES